MSVFNPRDVQPFIKPARLVNDAFIEYAAIQAAINAASSGETVFVPEGTWNEIIIPKTGVDLLGVGERDSIVISQTNAAPYVPAGTTVSHVRNITFSATESTVGRYAVEHRSSGITVLEDCSLIMISTSTLETGGVGNFGANKVILVNCDVVATNSVGDSTGCDAFGDDIEIRGGTVTVAAPSGVARPLRNTSGVCETFGVRYDTTLGDTPTFLDGDRTKNPHSHASTAEGGRAFTTKKQFVVVNRGRNLDTPAEIEVNTGDYGVLLPNGTDSSETRQVRWLAPPNFKGDAKFKIVAAAFNSSGSVEIKTKFTYGNDGENPELVVGGTGFQTIAMTQDQQDYIIETSLFGVTSGDLVNANLERDANLDSYAGSFMVAGVIFEWEEWISEGVA